MDEYPTEDELDQVRKWEGNYPGLMAFVRRLWNWPDWGFQKEGATYRLHTGGWSGNEDVVVALQENQVFWIVCWRGSRRGGHYKFEVRGG